MSSGEGEAARGRGEGFEGQRLVVLPRDVVAAAAVHPLLRGLMPTDIGHFPRAAGHHRSRPDGAAETVVLACVDGRGWCSVRGRTHGVGVGDLVVLPRGEPHSYGAEAADPWTIDWVHLAGPEPGALLETLGWEPSSPVRRAGAAPSARAAFVEALRVLEAGYTTAHLVRASRLIAEHLTACLWSVEPTGPAGRSVQERVDRALAHAHARLAEPVTVAELAAVAHWAPTQFKRRFRERTGYGPHEYLVRLRLHRACQLLDTGMQPVKEVAAAVGYADPLWFSRAFRAIVGVSPTEYRARAKG